MFETYLNTQLRIKMLNLRPNLKKFGSISVMSIAYLMLFHYASYFIICGFPCRLPLKIFSDFYLE